MRSPYGRIVSALLLIGLVSIFANAQEKREPVSEKELLSLIAGNALSEDIAHEIETRNLGFTVTDQARTLIAAAGGDALVLAAIEKARPGNKGASAEKGDSPELLQHLSAAGKFLKNEQLDEAASELATALQNGGGAETGFVMGQVLQKKEAWPQAVLIYREILRQDPEFSEAHLKLSFALLRSGDTDEALRESKLALTRMPGSAEAHKIAGLIFVDFQKYDAAELEYREALRIKPDYALVHYDLGVIFTEKKELDKAIEEYKKSIALDPTNDEAHYNLAYEYSAKRESDGAIREYRETIRLNPQMYEAYSNLGSELMQRNMNAEAVAVYRKLEAITPDSSTCHLCLGNALFNTWDFEGARKEYSKAIELDPTEAGAHVGLGNILDQQKKYDEALQEFRKAEEIDKSASNEFAAAGRVLIEQKKYAEAMKELKTATNLKPGSSYDHDLYGQALAGSGDVGGSIDEFKQASVLDPKNAQIKVELATALEKNGEWVKALDQFRQAAQADPSSGMQTQYKVAEERFNQRLAAMKAAGKSADAKAIEGQIQASKTEPGISEKLDAAMQAGWNAMVKGQIDEAEIQYKTAVGLAEKMQPRDQRLATSLIRLANVYGSKRDIDQAMAMLHRALAANVELYGADSPTTTEPLQNLGMAALFRDDYAGAIDYFSRAVAVNEKTFGETSDKVADSLRFMAMPYIKQNAYDKAEPYLLRAVRINESLFGPNQSTATSIPLWELCNLYDKWGKPEKAEPRYRQMLAILEKEYSPESPVLLSTLKSDANALHRLGREEDAAQVEKRMETIRAASGQPDGVPPQPQH